MPLRFSFYGIVDPNIYVPLFSYCTVIYFKLLINFLKNNKEVFSDFVIDNTKIYLKKYHIDDKNYKIPRMTGEFFYNLKNKYNILYLEFSSE